MRCARRMSLRLNRCKAEELHAVVSAYAAEKDDHLRWLAPERFASLEGERVRRDELVRARYASPHGLQDRMWKTAWKDAHETVARFWAAIGEDVRRIVGRKQGWSDEMRHYGFWLASSPRRVAALYVRRTPAPPFAVPPKERSAVVRVLGHEVRKRVTRLPRVRKARSACFDAGMYTIETDGHGRQTIRLMSLAPRRRMGVPLLGNASVGGNIRLVMEPGARTCEIHTGFDLRPARGNAAGEDAAIDIGQSEVLTDDHGRRYGKGFGAFLKRASAHDLDKGRKRAKLHAVRREARARGDPAKARRVLVNNLGHKKQGRRRERTRAECARLVNTAFREFLRHRRPARFAQERLDFRGKGKSKEMSRRTVQMRNATIGGRSHFLASAAGVCRKRVNPAFSSQPCPRCGYVHPKNRAGDRFVCLYCGWAGQSDRVGAHNLRRRMDDPEITLWMPKDRVRTILLARFSSRTGERPDWKPQGDCSGADSRHQATARGGRWRGSRKASGSGRGCPPARGMNRPGQPESETAEEIPGCGGKPRRKGRVHDAERVRIGNRWPEFYGRPAAGEPTGAGPRLSRGRSCSIGCLNRVRKPPPVLFPV